MSAQIQYACPIMTLGRRYQCQSRLINLNMNRPSHGLIGKTPGSRAGLPALVFLQIACLLQAACATYCFGRVAR